VSDRKLIFKKDIFRMKSPCHKPVRSVQSFRQNFGLSDTDRRTDDGETTSCTATSVASRGEWPGARFTKYLTTILRLSYDNTKVTIDFRRTSYLQKHPTKGARFLLGTIHLQTCKIVLDSVRKLAYDIPKKNLALFKSLS